MTAFAVIEMTLKDSSAMKRYADAVGPLIKRFGGEFIGSGPWHVLWGDAQFEKGAIIQFPNREAAIETYTCPDYLATLEDRALGADIRIRIIG